MTSTTEIASLEVVIVDQDPTSLTRVTGFLSAILLLLVFLAIYLGTNKMF